MLVKEFLTKLNLLAKYTLGMANSGRGKLNIFIRDLRLDIAKDVIILDNLPMTF